MWIIDAINTCSGMQMLLFVTIMHISSSRDGGAAA